MTPFYAENHWFQDLTAFLWFVSSFFVFTNNKKNICWPIGGLFLFLFSLDETFMIHECLKISLLKSLRLNFVSDVIILFYGLLSLLGAIYFIFFEKNDYLDKVLIISSLVAVSLIVGIDVFRINFIGDHSVEEALEFLVGGLVIIYTFKKKKIHRYAAKDIIVFWSLTILFFTCGIAIRTFLHPQCPLPKHLFE